MVRKNKKQLSPNHVVFSVWHFVPSSVNLPKRDTGSYFDGKPSPSSILPTKPLTLSSQCTCGCHSWTTRRAAPWAWAPWAFANLEGLKKLYAAPYRPGTLIASSPVAVKHHEAWGSFWSRATSVCCVVGKELLWESDNETCFQRVLTTSAP